MLDQLRRDKHGIRRARQQQEGEEGGRLYWPVQRRPSGAWGWHAVAQPTRLEAGIAKREYRGSGFTGLLVCLAAPWGDADAVRFGGILVIASW